MRNLPDQKFEGEYLFAARRRVIVLVDGVETTDIVEVG